MHEHCNSGWIFSKVNRPYFAWKDVGIIAFFCFLLCSQMYSSMARAAAQSDAGSNVVAVGVSDQSGNSMERGILLRQELDQRFENLRTQGQVKPVPLGRNDIEDILQKYISNGSMIESAHEILLAAGFVLTIETNPRFFPPGTYTHAVLDRSQPKFLGQSFVETTFDVRFRHSLEDPSLVKNLTAEIFVENRL